jgi:hypothetical protein
MKNTSMAILIVSGAILLLGPAFFNCPAVAQATTSVVAFQGRVTLSSGTAPADGPYDIRFTLFDASTAGSQLWTQTNTGVSVTRGLFTVGLGSVAPLPASLFSEEPDLYLEIAIDTGLDGIDAGDVQSPRTPLNAVPVALEAGNAGMLGGRLPYEYALTNDVLFAGTFFDFTDDIDSIIATKVDQSALDAALTALNLKANQSAVNAALATKADTAALFQWLAVTSGPVNMLPNRGYAVNSASEVVLNLPASASLSFGDVVRVSSPGAGGWRIAQGTGQSVKTMTLRVPAYSSGWIPRNVSASWSCVASSAGGTRLVAGDFDGQFHTSTDGGLTWTPRLSGHIWVSAASSADGMRLLAAAENDQLFVSTDSGVTWTARESSRNWISVASSADGMKLVAVEFSGKIYTSTDGGVGWSPRESVRQWTSVASSADGMRLLACVANGTLHMSTDGGLTWTPRDSERAWRGVASSADGTRLLAAPLGDRLYVSKDSGDTWTPREGTRDWFCAAVSADGTRLLAAVSSGRIYTSTDDGFTWLPQAVDEVWSAVASSADGSRLIGAVNGDQLYTYSLFTERSTPGATGGLSGESGTTIELLYVGDDAFLPLSYVGDLRVF